MSQALIQNAPYHLHTLWLFTYNDLKTMVLPSTAFALSTGLAKILSRAEGNQKTEINHLLQQIPATILWTWANCLAFNVNNQKLPHAVEEDILNKPWRPVPSKRITAGQARVLGTLIYPVVVLMSIILTGGTTLSLLLVIFGYLYNDLRLGDRTALLRNVLNACGFTSFAAGASEVALKSRTDFDIVPWLGMVGAIVFTTVHIQDLYDQIGDAAAGRLTVPLVYGDGLARWTIIVPIIVWSYLCPYYWGVRPFGYAPVGILGVLILVRLILMRSVEADKRTFLVYNIWLVAIYCIPLIALM